jgi:hypothetical protein
MAVGKPALFRSLASRAGEAVAVTGVAITIRLAAAYGH